MTEKVALYQKYRPTRLSEIIGQDHAKQIIENSANQNRISHAYLFTGPRGTGKTTLARIFSRIVNCDNAPSVDYADDDPFVSEINNGRFIDIVELDAASNTSIDDIRQIRRDAFDAPVMGKKKVFIIDEVHCLKEAAISALLKILEEPPSSAMFVLCIDGEEKVYDGDGFVSIRDLEINSKIWTKDGFSLVKNKFYKGKDSVFKLKTNKGTELNLTKEHEVEIFDGKNFVWKKAKNISKGDFIPVHNSYNTNRGLGFSVEECELIGRIVGDGYYTYKKLGVLFNKKEWDYGRSLLDSCELSYSFVEKESVFEVTIHNESGILKTRWGMEDYTRGNKKLPLCVPMMSEIEFLAFTKGIVGADGHDSGKGVVLYQNNYDLLIELRNIMMSHGIVTTVSYNKRIFKDNSKTTGIKNGTYDSYQLIFRKKHDSIPISEEYRNELIGSDKIFRYLKYNSGYSEHPNYSLSREKASKGGLSLFDRNIFYEEFHSLEYVGEKDVYDLEMDNESHSFCVNGITVHNCTTDPQKVKATILSRCQTIKLREVPVKDLSYYFSEICEKEGVRSIEDGSMDLIAKAARGSVRDGLSMLDSVIGKCGLTIDKDTVIDLVGCIDQIQSFNIVKAISECNIKKSVISLMNLTKKESKDPIFIFNGLLEIWHDLLMSKTLEVTNKAGIRIDPRIEEDFIKVREKMTLKEINYCLQTTSKFMSDLHFMPRADFMLDSLVTHLCDSLSRMR